MLNWLHRYGLKGLLILTINWLLTKAFFRPARLIRMPCYIRGRKSISWGAGFTSGVGTRLDAFGDGSRIRIKIGNGVQINDYVHIGAIESVSIGNDVLIASKVFISDHNHGQYEEECHLSNPNVPPVDRPLYSSPVLIKDRVWIGENVCVMPGVTIHEGSIIGAGAVVTHDIPPNTIAVGVPAKPVKVFDDKQKKWIKTI